MSKLHISNAFFEWELETQTDIPLHDAFRCHPAFLQLQFLPVIYASSSEGFLLSDPPEQDYWEVLLKKGIAVPKPCSLSDGAFTPFVEVESWGYSRIIAHWAEQHGLLYKMPDWKIVSLVNSKEFSFLHSPRLPFAEFITDESSVHRWMKTFPGKKVIKSVYGVTGRGHFLIDDEFSEQRLASFLIREFEQGRGVVAEPWVERVLDFSTQWNIDSHIEYLGATLCENNAKGQYRLSHAAKEDVLFGTYIPYLIEHKNQVINLLEKIKDFGFFGNVGVDAMLYLCEEGKKVMLHPVVEINARKTMGWAALMFQKRYCPDAMISFRYAPIPKNPEYNHQTGYLPSALYPSKGKTIRFTRNLVID